MYSLTTGKETAHFTAEANAAEFTILGPRAFFAVTGPSKGPPFGAVQPRTLKAVDLKTGKRPWELPLEGERLPPPPPPRKVRRRCRPSPRKITSPLGINIVLPVSYR